MQLLSQSLGDKLLLCGNKSRVSYTRISNHRTSSSETQSRMRTRDYTIDFGLAIKYRNKTGRHVSKKIIDSPAGTPAFMSINTHKNIHQTRRDDMESLP